MTDIEHAYQQAIVKGDADCAFELAKHLEVESGKVAVDLLIGNVNGDLGPMLDMDNIKSRVHQVGYFTSMPAVDKWITALKKTIDESHLADTEKRLLLITIKDERQDLLDWLPYVGRYVRTADQADVTRSYQSDTMEMRDQSFVQRQRKHANTMRTHVQKRIDSGEFSSLVKSQQFYAIERDSLAAFSSNARSAEAEASLQHYRTPRDIGGFLLHTNFFIGNSPNTSRYDSDYPIAKQEMALQKQRQSVSKNIRRLMIEGIREGELYTLTYEDVELTSILFDGIVWRWLHSEPAIIRDHWGKVETIVSSLLTTPPDHRNDEWFASYKQQWLTAFWLSSNFCLFPRGSAQGTQNSLNEICRRQQLPAPIARKEHPMLNTIAITLPLEEFLERIDEFIEPWELSLD